MRHIPVMLEESLAIFADKQMRFFFDGTLGGGGFAKALLQMHPEIETYFGCDRDEHALEIAQETLGDCGKKVCFIHGNFSDLDTHLTERGIDSVNGFFLT